MKDPKPIVIERNGEVIGLFASITSAGHCIGLTEKGIRNRISNGLKRNPEIYRYASPEEAELIRKILPAPPKEPTPELIKGLRAPRKPGKRQSLKELEEGENEELELLKGKYDIIQYELAAGRVCITPCPYRESPKPKVGSALCLSCTSFHGRNRVRQQIACSAVSGKNWKNKAKDKEEL